MSHSKKRKSIIPSMTSAASSRRERFAGIRRSVVGVAVVPPNLQQMIASGQLAVKRGRPLGAISIVGTGFKVAEPNLFLTARHVLDPLLRILEQHSRNKTAPPFALQVLVLDKPVNQQDGGTSWHIELAPIIAGATSKFDDVTVFQVALTRPDGSQLLIPAVRRAHGCCEEGDEIATCGFPFGLELHSDQLQGIVVAPSFSHGIVSATLPFPGAPRAIRTVFQVNAMINRGNSGGPVFDARTGDVFGVISSSMTIPIPDATKPEEQWLQIPTGIARAVYIDRVDEMVTAMSQQAAASIHPRT